MPLRALQQATHVRTANGIGAVQHDQPELIESCRPTHRFVYQQMHAMLPARQCEASTIATEIVVERYYRRSIRADYS